MRYLIGLIFFLSTLTAQVTDKNFKDKAGSGFVVVKFTSEWQEQDLDKNIFNGVEGHEDAIIIEVKDSNTKKLCKKLRIRNFPSIALFLRAIEIPAYFFNRLSTGLPKVNSVTLYFVIDLSIYVFLFLRFRGSVDAIWILDD